MLLGAPDVGQGEYGLCDLIGRPRHAVSEANPCDRVTVPGVDLHAWMLNDVADVHRRLHGVLDGVPAERWTEPAPGDGPSLAHLALHLARHQDVAVRTAVRNRTPRFLEHRDALGLADAPVCAALAEQEDPAVTAAVDLDALVVYVDAVFASTTSWLDELGSLVLDSVPDTARRLTDLAGIPGSMGWLVEMWSGRPVWWFLQWPVIGHGHAHVGQASALRAAMGLSPFAKAAKP